MKLLVKNSTPVYTLSENKGLFADVIKDQVHVEKVTVNP